MCAVHLTAMHLVGLKVQMVISAPREKQADLECQERKEMLETWAALEILVQLVTVE